MKKRIETIKFLIKRSKVQKEPEAATILNEFDEVLRVTKLKPISRRCLMQVLYSTRAIDSALGVFLRARGIPLADKDKSIGKYLKKMTNHSVTGMSKLSDSERAHFQRHIASPRNKYMHQAGANPSGTHEIQTLLNEMHACLARALQL